MFLGEIGWDSVDWIDLAWDRVSWVSLIKMIIDL